MSNKIIGKEVPVEKEAHAVNYIKRKMKAKVEVQMDMPLSIYIPPANQFGKSGRSDIEFTIGDFATVYTEMKSPTGKIKANQQLWMEDQNVKHPLKPACIIFGKAGVDIFMSIFNKYIIAGSIDPYQDWFDFCHAIIKEPIIK